LFLELLIRALLRLHDEDMASVQVDRADAGRAVGMREPYRIFEAVAIARRIGGRGLGPIDAQHVAKLRSEGLEVGALGGAGCSPARDEGVDPILRCGLGGAQSHVLV